MTNPAPRAFHLSVGPDFFRGAEKTMKLSGVILMLVGAAVLIYGGFTYTTHKKAISMGPVQVESTHHHHVPLPPILGVALIGGGLLVYFGARGRP